MDSQIPSAEAQGWMLDNASAREAAAETCVKRGDKEMAKLNRDCAWAYRFVAEAAKAAIDASAPNAGIHRAAEGRPVE